MILLQTADDIQRIVTTDNATVQGILLGVAVAFMAATIYLYKENKQMQKDLVKEIKEAAKEVASVNRMYNDFVRDLTHYIKK